MQPATNLIAPVTGITRLCPGSAVAGHASSYPKLPEAAAVGRELLPGHAEGPAVPSRRD